VSRYLLDASALIALLRNEEGAERVKAVYRESRIHSVNLAEVVRIMRRYNVPEEAIRDGLDALGLDVMQVLDSKQAYAAGVLAHRNKPIGLSIGDAVCLTVAAGHEAVLTTEMRWERAKGLPKNVHIECIR
jgi:ribonuclease VapC